MEVEHPDYMYEPVRVDINAKGKHRARKNNLVQPSQVRFFSVASVVFTILLSLDYWY